MLRFLASHRRAIAILTGPLVLLIAAVAAPSCKTVNTKKVPGTECVGGTYDEDGVCIGLCEDSLCPEANTCVANECRLRCDTHYDCDVQTQECVNTQNDQGIWSRVCLSSHRLPVPGLGGFGTSCELTVPDRCTAFACPNSRQCDLHSCDGNPSACLRDEEACGDDPDCSIGKCDGTDWPCTFNTCPDNECTKFECLGQGDGDAYAYCTHHDCSDDGDCPAGYYCGKIRDPRQICNSPKGEGDSCGETPDPCLDPGAFGQNGGTFFEGPSCLMRNTCLKRTTFSPCSTPDTNLDCSLIEEPHLCVTLNLGAPTEIEAVCARFCQDNTDCYNDQWCSGVVGRTCAGSPWTWCGLDTDCPTPGDVCQDRQVCVPSSGAANGGGYCRRCRDDTQCGVEDGWACLSPAGSVGERACHNFDLFPCPGGSNNECPIAPSGAHGKCLNEDDGVNPGHELYHRCYFPYSYSKGFTCYPY